MGGSLSEEWGGLGLYITILNYYSIIHQYDLEPYSFVDCWFYQ